MAGRVGQTWLPTSKICSDQIFLIIFYLKKNHFGSMLCKNLLRTKIGIVSFGPSDHVQNILRKLILIFNFRPEFEFSDLYTYCEMTEIA